MKIIVAFLNLFLFCCQDSQKNRELDRFYKLPDTSNTELVDSIISQDLSKSTTNDSLKQNDFSKMSVLLLPCSNGYDFGTSGYDFVPIMSRELEKFEGIVVVPFPYKTLMNTSYYGVYDKRYCKPIIDKVEADYFLMARYSETHPDIYGIDTVKWGYEIRILNTKTMHQMTSIGKKDLKDYNAIENDIITNINSLVKDMRNLK